MHAAPHTCTTACAPVCAAASAPQPALTARSRTQRIKFFCPQLKSLPPTTAAPLFPQLTRHRLAACPLTQAPRPNTHLSCFCTSLPMLAAPLHPFCYTRLCTAAPSRRPLFISTKPAVPTPSPPLIPRVNTPRGMRRPHRPFAFPNNAAAFVTVHLNDAHSIRG